MSGGDSTTSAMEIAGEIDSTDADIKSQILSAMRFRVTYLREKADSFTFESVRRLLEEDLKLEKFALDVHKSFVKQHLVQCLEGADEEGTSENSQESKKKDAAAVKEASTKVSKNNKVKKDVKEDTTGADDEKMEDSPVMGLLAEENTSKSVEKQRSGEESKEVMQSEIKKALRKRSSYIKANSESITMGSLRRLLEQDLKLEKNSLDTYKKFISEELDEVLHATKSSSVAKKKNQTKKVKPTTENSESEELSDSDGDDKEEEEEVAAKKKTVQKRKSTKSEGTGKRKREKEKVAPAKKTKQTDLQSGSDEDEETNAASSEKSVKKQETVSAGYGKRVEHLKSIIKSCGMSVPPVVYRKAKQAPEEKREDTLIKELKEILAKEGLSSNPSEKEIKEVKKRKERTKELEGIDTSNIVSSSRRRSSMSFVPPPKPIKADESESDESEDSENEEDDEDDEVVEEEGEEEEEEDEKGEEGEEEDEEEEEEEEKEGNQPEGEPKAEDGGEDESE